MTVAQHYVSELTLGELLCLKTFSSHYGEFGLFDDGWFVKAATAWAERELISGEESDNVMILASLSLDDVPDRYEVQRYLSLCQQERGMSEPALRLSALVWLRLALNQLMKVTTAAEIEHQLSFFMNWYLDYPPPVFAKITNMLSSYYWELYDEAIPAFYSRASEMSDDELLSQVKERVRPLIRFLSSKDWIDVLAKEKSQ